jgi:hypothetical protein
MPLFRTLFGRGNADRIPEYLAELKGRLDDGDDDEATRGLATAALPPVETQLVLPAPGLYAMSPPARQFAIAQTVEALLAVGRLWHSRHPDRPVGIGDISKRGGGQFPPHQSHKRGTDIDIRLLRKDGVQEGTDFTSPNYSRPLTQELIDVFHAGGVLGLTKLFFNDPEAEGASFASGHHNHLHVGFVLPGAGPVSPLLVEGNRKPAVRELQRRLNGWIATAGAMPPLTVSGHFDATTLAAVRAFQGAMGLEADGRCGERTWARLPAV